MTEEIIDYSTLHRPVGCLTERLPSCRDDASPYFLTPEQIAQYHQHGFLGHIPVLSPEQCAQLLTELDQLADPQHPHPGHHLFYEYHANESQDPDHVLMHALGHWRITPGFHDLVFLPSLTVPSSQLIRSDKQFSTVRFWHDQLFCKPPHCGGNVAWHQDYSYWTRTTPMQHMTVHVALDDQSPENGAIMYIPGSHRWTRNGGEPLPITARDFVDMDSVQEILTQDEKEQWQPIHCCLKKGEAVFHHPLVVHGSFGNKSTKSRRSAVVNYFADGTVSQTDDPLLRGVPPISRGQACDGQFFPTAFDPAWCHLDSQLKQHSPELCI
eukprot:gene4150-8469_t